MSRPEDNLPEAQSGENPEQKKQMLVVSNNGAAAPAEPPANGTAATKAEKPSGKAKTGFAAAAPNNPDLAGDFMPDSKNHQSLVTPVVIKQSSGRAVAAVALVLSLLAVGASGFLFVQGQNLLKTQELDFNQKIDKAALGESQNASLLQESLRKQGDNEAALAQIINGQKQNAEQIAAANRAYQELLKGRADWLVDETETMLNLASQQLLLSGNVPAAVGVLETVEGRLNRFDHPELLPIKQALSQDLAALKNRPYLDVSSTSLRLDRLETAVAGLPLMVDGTLKPGQKPPAEPAAGLSWWENAWQKTLASLKGMVEVRRLNNNDAMLISPEQVYFVRENLRLRLLDARTALLQHNGEVYQSDLNSAEAAVKQYFDARSPATQSWLKELAELKALDLRMISDDSLKASLNAVRSYQESARTNRPALPAAGEASAASAPASAPAVPAASEPAANAPVAPTSPSALRQPDAQEEQPVKPAVEPLQRKPAPANEVKGERA